MNASWISLALLSAVLAGLSTIAAGQGGAGGGGGTGDGGGGAEDGWRRALPGWRYEFPADHFTHPGFKTEWWYVTGRVRTAAGRRFGYQFTIFRRGLRPPAERAGAGAAAGRSRWVVNELPLGHFALTDIDSGRFYFEQKLVRGAFGEAGFDRAGSAGGDGLYGPDGRLGPDGGGGAGEPAGPAAGTDRRPAWIGDWELGLAADGGMRVRASQAGAALDLKLTPPPAAGRPAVVVNGTDGLSRKSAGAGNASHYYSMPRLATSGTVTVGGKTEAVTGLSWLDREWATNQLSGAQVGWDWLALHLSDGSDLMLYQLRGADGKGDAFSSGTFVSPEGGAEHLTSRDFSLSPAPGQTWRSPKSGGTYPTGWRIEVPGKTLRLELRALLPDQELALDPVTYWEGAVDAAGSRGGREIRAEGYLEMTGYSGALRALRE